MENSRPKEAKAPFCVRFFSIGHFPGLPRSVPRTFPRTNVERQASEELKVRPVRDLAPLVHLKPLPPGCVDYRHKRWLVFDQLLAYENNYLRSLQFLTYDLQAVLMESDDILKRSVTLDIFAYLNEVRNLHEQLRGWMALAADGWAEKEIVGWALGALLEQPALLKVYSMFVSNYQRACTLMAAQLATNAPLHSFLEAKLQECSEKQSFDGFFLRPIQRMIHLKLQILELVKCTPAGHPDRPMLEQCYDRVRLIVSQLDALWGHVGLLGQLMKKEHPAGVPRGSYAQDWARSQLLHYENLQHSVFDRNGHLVRVKCRRVFLMSDRVVCASVDFDEEPLHAFNDIDGITLKWVVPLQDTELRVVVASGLLSEPVAGLTDGYVEMLKLMHDFSTMAEIEQLTCVLHNPYGQLNPCVMGTILDQIEASMQSINNATKDAEACYASTALMMVARRERNRVRREKRYLLQFLGPFSKRRWLTNARMAKRALRTLKTSAWWTHADQLFATVEPLFLYTFPTMQSHLRSKITCGCYYAPNLASPLYEKLHLSDWLRNRNTLWLCTFDGASTYVTLYTHDLLTNCIAGRTRFTLQDEIVECIAHVPVGQVVPDDPTTVDTVWLGTRGKLLIYSGAYPLLTDQVACIDVQGTPERLLYRMGRVYVGLSTGNVLVYRREPLGWNVATPLVVRVSAEPIVALLTIKSTVYVAAGSAVYVLAPDTDRVRKALDIASSSGDGGLAAASSIALMAYSSNGVWIVRVRSSVVSLYQLRTGRLLQHIDVTKHVMHFVPKISEQFFASTVYVSALATIDDSLWIGTNVGLTLMMVLPRPANIPVLSDFVHGAKHGHLQNVNFLLPMLPAPLEGESPAVKTDDDGDDDGEYEAFDCELSGISDDGRDSQDISPVDGPEAEEADDEAFTLSDDELPSSSSTFDTARAEGGHTASDRPLELESFDGEPDGEDHLEPEPQTSSASYTGSIRKVPTDQPSEANAAGLASPFHSVLILVGGEGYVNWHAQEDGPDSATTGSLPSNRSTASTASNTTSNTDAATPVVNSPRAQVVLWEKRINRL